MTKRSTSPRILLYDLETSHNICAVFRLYDSDNGIPHQNILTERYIISGSWKWLDEKRVYATAVKPGANPSDKEVCQRLYEAIAASDIVVAHNGNEFDWKWLQGRLIFHGFPPLPPITKIDTLHIARSQFLFNSNRLDYLGQYLGLGRKTKTEPELWLKVLAGDARAIKQMVSYNKQDVLLLEKIFLKLRPYMSQLNRQMYEEIGEVKCPRCGSEKTRSKGLYKATTRTYQRRQCFACGGWYRSQKAIRNLTVTTRPI